MRLNFKLSPNTQPVPFDYQHFLTGKFHKWLGNNDLHDSLSLYSLSWFSGGQRSGTSLSFPDGATWFVSSHDPEVLIRICRYAQDDPSVCCGMHVTNITITSMPEAKGKRKFSVASPVLAKGNKIDGKVKHFTFNEVEADDILTKTLRHKLDKAGLGDFADQASVSFDRTYPKAHTKLVHINGSANRASICPVIIEGPQEVLEFAWNVGIGHLTGSGFGALA